MEIVVKEMRSIGVALVTVFLTIPIAAMAQGKKGQPETVEGALAAISNQVSMQPKLAIDFSQVSGEYCINADLSKGGHMTHYAIDPTKTREDMVDFVNAESLIQAGIDVESLPRHPGKLGSMTPNVWYFLPAGEFEPHHGKKMRYPLLIRATDIN